MERKVTKLDGEWELGFSKRGKRFRWIKAQVPGDVHLDLTRAGFLEEPLYGMNAKKCSWTAETIWHYRKKFYLDKLEEDARYELTFYGLDTTCTISLNEHEIGKHNNMFIPYTIDITRFLVVGENTLLVEIDSGINQYKDKCSINIRNPIDPSKMIEFTPVRVWIRKAQFTFGWDWAPVLLTCGIWRSVILKKYKILALRNPYITTKINRHNATVNISFELEKFVDRDIRVEIRTKIGKVGKTIKETSKSVTVGKKPLLESIRIENPSLWWPIPFGRPNLYEISIAVYENGFLLDSYNERFCIRDVKIEQKSLGHGEKTFTFVVNGKRIFAKGANWVPADSILARVRSEKYKELIMLAKEANFNMLRVWGGGIYEDEKFYRLCDENGIMVWQDFMFACPSNPDGWYPDNDREFVKTIKREFEIIVKQLRNHPSIVVWCGNNESEAGGSERNIEGKMFGGWKIYHRILPGICKRFDPVRTYWPGSPYSCGEEKDDPNSPKEGDRHTWDGVPNYRRHEDEGKFISEFYAFAPPVKETLEKFLPPGEMRMDSPAWKFHYNRWPCIRKFTRFAIKEFMGSKNVSLEDYLLSYQLYQGESYRYAIEYFRRRKFICSGSLFWMFNDCWGTTGSWTIVDYYLNTPLAYYYVQRAYAPILLSFREEKDGVSVWIVNDYLKKFQTTIVVRQIDFTEGEKHRWEKRLDIGENTSQEVMRIHLGKISLKEKTRQYLYGELKCRGEVIADNTYFFENPKYLLLPKVKLSKSYQIINSNTGILTLKSDFFVYVVEVSGLKERLSLDDNYFNINPGEEKGVVIRGKDITFADLKDLKIKPSTSW